METALPGGRRENIDVGAFEQGTGFSRWALSRYLVGRAIGESVSASLLAVVVAVLGLAALSQWAGHLTAVAVLFVLLALGLLLLRMVLRVVLRRFAPTVGDPAADQRLRALVRDTHSDVLRELRRLHLPGRTVTLPVLALRLMGRRRRETMGRLRRFDLERVVPPSRLDELHMVLRGGADRPGSPGRMSR